MKLRSLSYLSLLFLVVAFSVACSGAPANPCDGANCTDGTRCHLGKCVPDCKDGQTECGETCADLKTDKANCGKCGTACRDGESCFEGTCTKDCAEGTTLCDGVCIDTKKDVRNCGACGTTCKDGEVCKDGSCEVFCASGQENCDGTCTNVQSDNKNCGSCGTACGDGEVCTSGKCEFACQKGQVQCEQSCVNVQTDRAHCGACKNACKDGEVCNAGKCELSCGVGTKDCSGGCVNVQTDRANCGDCGKACGDGEVCSAGTCELSCQKDLKKCGTLCVNTQTDRANCGDCGTACKAGEVCNAGKCELTCTPNTTECNGSCVNLQTDNSNCGKCGEVCSGGKQCTAGKCECPSGETDCKGTCVDVQTDRANCGTCDTTCKSGELCAKGICLVSCPSGQAECGGKCIDLQTSNTHCGKCATACTGGKSCTAGVCGCPTGQTDCNGTCVDLQKDGANCGKCGTACSTGKLCEKGACACPTGQTDCNGTCVDTQSDKTNCGKCGTTCNTGQVCFQGACSAFCKAGETNCGGACVDVTSSTANCGACGNACKAGEVCSASQCKKLNNYYIAAGGSASDYGRALAADSKGNVYVVGYFYSDAVFGSTSLSSKGSADIFLAKLDVDGKWLWAKNLGGSSLDYGYGVAVDNKDNVYITGSMQSGVVLGTTTFTSKGGHDVHVTKFDSKGKWLWTRTGGSSSSDYGYGLGVDATGNVYVSGYTYGSPVFGSFTLNNAGSADAFVAKLSSTGNWMWVKGVGGTGSDFANDLRLDKVGNIYISGDFSGKVTVGKTTLSSAGGSDLFVAKMDSNGQVKWVAQGGGTSTDLGRNLAVDGTGNVYVAGYTNSSSTWGTTTLSSNGSTDIFVGKLSPMGNWMWVKNVGGSGFDYGWGVATDPAGNVYLSGYFQNSVVMGGTTLTSKGNRDFFLAKLDPTGFWLSAQSGGNSSSDYGYGAAVDPFGNAYLTGYLSGTGTNSFMGMSLSVASGQGNTIFVARMLATGCPQPCKAGEACCAGTCRKLATDANNCSACFQSCSLGGTCAASKCACPTGTTACGSACVNTQTSNSNCGACGKTCGGGQVCSAGTCGCPTGLTLCSGACLDVSSDAKNCGGCGKACKAGEQCQSSKCVSAWAQSGGGKSGSDYGYGVGVDATGNVYVTGYFYSGSSSSPTTLLTFGKTVLTGKGGSDVFVAKFNSAGALQKAIVMGGKGSDYAYNMAVDGTGNVYVTGRFTSGSSSSPTTLGTFGSLTLTGKGGSDVFVAKLDKDLKVLKAEVMGGKGTDYGYGVDYDATGNVYVAGYWSTGSSTSPTTLGTFGTTTLTGKGGYDMFVAKLDKDLKVLKTNQGGGKSSDYAYDLDVDSAGNVFVVGRFNGGSTATTLGTFGTFTLTSKGWYDIFVAQYDKDLKLTKVVSAGGKDYEYAYGVVSDGKGNVYVTGSFYAGSSSNPSTLGTFGTTTLTGKGSYDFFVAKLDKDLKFVKAVTGGATSTDHGYDVALDATGNVHITGYVASTSSPFTIDKASLKQFGSTDLLYLKFDKDLKYLSGKRGGSKSYDYGYRIAVSGPDFYISGYFGTDFTAGGANLKSFGSSDIFVTKNIP